jgi:hypothetical protein
MGVAQQVGQQHGPADDAGSSTTAQHTDVTHGLHDQLNAVQPITVCASACASPVIKQLCCLLADHLLRLLSTLLGSQRRAAQHTTAHHSTQPRRQQPHHSTQPRRQHSTAQQVQQECDALSAPGKDSETASGTQWIWTPSRAMPYPPPHPAAPDNPPK